MDKQCRLCLVQAPLRQSHIIPEWCYRCIYDHKSRAFRIATDLQKSATYIQKGPREELLCDRCEQKLAVYEKYVREIIIGPRKLNHNRSQRALRLTGVDYSKLKLFQLSILWRAGISQLVDFHNINLGAHAETIRKMLNHEQPGDSTDYGCMMSALFYDDGYLLKDLILVEGEYLIEDWPAYRFIFAGIAWIFILSEGAESFRWKKLFLRTNGILIMPLVPASNTELFQELAQQLTRKENLSNALRPRHQ